MASTTPTWSAATLPRDDDDDDLEEEEEEEGLRRRGPFRRRRREEDEKDADEAFLRRGAVLVESEASNGGSSSRLEEEESVPVSHAVSSFVPLDNDANDNLARAPLGRAATCVAVDPSGARFVVGTAGGVLKLHDFGGMDKRGVRPFREIDTEDEGRHGVVALSFSPNNGGDRFLACTASAQPQIFDREGTSLLKFNRGDPYVRDPTRTTGHTTTVTGGEWQPREAYRVATCGVDGSVRLWDLCGKTGLRDWLFSETAIRVKDAKSRKAAATALAFSPDGRSIACGANDGSLQFWGLKGRAHAYHRPDAVQRDAHAVGSDASGAVLSSVVFSPTGDYLASRSDDGFARLWDVRKMTSLQKTKKNHALVAEFSLEATDRAQATANLAFSPNGNLLAAGNDDGAVLFFDVKKKKPRPHHHPPHTQPTSASPSSTGTGRTTRRKEEKTTTTTRSPRLFRRKKNKESGQPVCRRSCGIRG
mmetsp:Transcript_24704/g.79886  ORF Transcript_24704/g.79886 Transcript_24704/m.79886 type:complete len:476 (-) Transcript_24704:680-2107(-)